jgi:NADH-quinone oxidoreductase subunit J
VLDIVFFCIFALLTLGGGVLTITRRNAVHSAISLIVSLLGVAGLYLLQQAEFLFAVQIVLYIGGIMVLFLFVIMLVNLDEAAKQAQFNGAWALCLACLAGIGAEVWWFLSRSSSMAAWSKPLATVADAVKTPGNTERIADSLFSQYLLPFEVASVLLLVAVVGSVFMARKESPQE